MSDLLIRIHAQHTGMHPSEVLVEVGTPRRRVYADRNNIRDGWLKVYSTSVSDDQDVLIELPGIEATDGSRRLWIPLADCCPAK